MSRLPCSALCLLLLVACGDDDGGAHSSDASVADTAPLPDSLPDDCDYTEQQDATNDDIDSGSPEATNLTFTTSADTVVCGTIDASHFDGDITVDIDSFLITLATDADVLVRMNGPGAEAIEFVGVDVRAGSASGALVGTLTYYGDHGGRSVHARDRRRQSRAPLPGADDRRIPGGRRRGEQRRQRRHPARVGYGARTDHVDRR
jgi:hypothetical protein